MTARIINVTSLVVTFALGALVALIAVTAAANDGIATGVPEGTEANPMPQCVDAYTESVLVDLAATSQCTLPDGSFPMSASLACPDGRTLWWNDAGWGYLGEPAHLHAAGAEQVPPAADRLGCGAPW